MRVVITGGAGFIGSHLMVRLSKAGLEVVGLDNFSRYSRSGLEAIKERGLDVVKGDVRDFKKLVEVFRGADIVIHAAALTNVPESLRRPEEYMEVNALGTLNVARAARETGVSRVIYLSSAAIYGTPRELPIKETHPTEPTSPYGVSKLTGEHFLRIYLEDVEGSDYIILRLFNVYGPWQDNLEVASVVTKFAFSAVRGESLTIFGSGDQLRDFIHVSDVCEAVLKAMVTEVSDEVFNIGSGEATSINDLAKLIMELTGLKAKPRYLPPRPGDVLESWSSIEKAEKIFEFRPKVGLREGVNELIKWVKEYLSRPTSSHGVGSNSVGDHLTPGVQHRKLGNRT